MDKNCVICKQGEVRPGMTTVTLQRGEATIVIKGVPAQICADCGEYYLDEETTGVVMARAEVAVKNGAEVEIIRYAA